MRQFDLNPDYAISLSTCRGFAKRQLGQYEAAIEDYDEAIRLNPDYTYAYSGRGFAKRQLGQYEAATEDYDEAIKLKP